MPRNYSNIALDTTLTAGIGAGDLSCVVTSAAGWPAAPFAAVLDPGLAAEEVVQVTAKVGTTFTITRGFDGTTAQVHALGATVRHSAIAGDFTDLQAADTSEASTRATADSTHAALTTSAHGGIVASTDPRLTDSRTPLAHASTHASAGSDPVTLAESQVTNLVTDLALKAPLASPALTGVPTVPTAAPGTNTTQAASTAFVTTAVASASVADGDKGDVTVSGSGTVWTVDALPESRITNLVADLAAKLAVASNLSDLNNAGTARTNIGLGSLAVLSSITASLISDASANGRSLITATDYAAMKTLLALVVGTNVQAWDADLDTLAGMGATRAGLLAALPAFVQSLLDDVDAATARATLVAAPRSATYITQTADSELSAEQALGSLASGYLKNTTTTGVLSVQATPIPSADLGSGSGGAGTKFLADDQTYKTPSAGASASGASGSIFDHFFTVPTSIIPTGPFSFTASAAGSGATIAAVAIADSDTVGQIGITTGTTTTGKAAFNTGLSAFRFGGGAYTLTVRFRTLTLFDGTDTGAFYIGWIDSQTAAPTDGVYLYWDNTQTNFRYRTRNNSTETDTDSGLAPAASTWYYLKIAINAAGTSITFTLGTTNLTSNSQTLTTNIPTSAGRETGMGAVIIKSAGTNAREIDFDYWKLDWAMTNTL